MIGHAVTVSVLPVVKEMQYFRPEAVVAVCRQGGRLQPHQSRFFLLYRDPTQQFGAGMMPLDVNTFPQAVKATEALGVPLMKRTFGGEQSVSEARVSRLHIGGIETHTADTPGAKSFIVQVPAIQYLRKFYSIGTVEEFLAELPTGIAHRFVQLTEPTEQTWWRYWYDVTSIQKVKLAPSQYGKHAPCVQVYTEGHWQELRTEDLAGVIAKIEAAGVVTTCLRIPKE